MKLTESPKHTNSLNNENTSLTPGAAHAAAGKISVMNNITYFDSYYMLHKEGQNYMKEIIEGKYIGGNAAYIMRDTEFNDLFASAENINWWHENVGPDFKLAFIVKPKKK